jgi:hypothetical protein
MVSKRKDVALCKVDLNGLSLEDVCQLDLVLHNERENVRRVHLVANDELRDLLLLGARFLSRNVQVDVRYDDDETMRVLVGDLKCSQRPRSSRCCPLIVTLIAVAVLLCAILSATTTNAGDADVAPWRALPETHVLRRKLQRHAELSTQQVPFSVLWNESTENNAEAELHQLLAVFGADRVMRVQQCEIGDVKERVERMRAPALVLFERACDVACQDALTILLDDSLPQMQRSASAVYVLRGCSGDDAMADRLRHRVKHSV